MSDHDDRFARRSALMSAGCGVVGLVLAKSSHDSGVCDDSISVSKWKNTHDCIVVKFKALESVRVFHESNIDLDDVY